MKAKNIKKNLDKAQIAISFFALLMFIFKSVVWRYDSVECLVAYILFFIPFLSAFLCPLFSQNRNPRKLIQISLLALFPGMIVSIFDLSHFHILPMLEDMAGESYYYIILGVMLVLGFVILNACYISRYFYSAILVLLSSLALFFSFSAFLLFEYIQAFDMLAYALLFISLTLYAPKLNNDNEYDPKLYKFLIEDDEKQKTDFDVIVDAITDYSISLAEYDKVKNAYDFYYAVKNEDHDKIKALNIYGRKAITEVFKSWLDFEKYFESEEDDKLFFRVCKYLSSDKITDEEFSLALFDFACTVSSGTNCFGSADIYMTSDKPWNRLSHLYDNGFSIGDTEFTSMESFLQGIKFKNIQRQAEVFKMTGKDAKRAGKHHNLWKITGNLYYKGTRFKRNSEDYQLILDSVYYSLYEQNAEFRHALIATGLRSLEHSLGKKSKRATVLTREEYLFRLNLLRDIEFNKYLNK